MIPDIATVQKINTDRHRGNVILALAEALGNLNNAIKKRQFRLAEFHANHILSLSEHLISLGDYNENQRMYGR